MKKLKLIIFQLLLTFLFLSACNNISENKKDKTQETEGLDTLKGSSLAEQKGINAISNQTDQMLEKYHELKEALVETDTEKAQKSAIDFADLTKILSEKAASEEQAQLILAIQKSVEQIAKSDNIEAQRELFVPLTAHVYEMAKAFPNDKAVYYAYCPMAFNDKGAYWLEKEKTILNPYFGSKMLKCGSIKETIAIN